MAWFTVASSGFELLAGTPTSFRSRDHATRTFCPTCGTQLTFVDDATPGQTDVTTCSLDAPESAVPRDHTFACRKLSWLKLGDGLPQFRRSRSEG